MKAVVKGVPTVYSACEEFVTKKHNKNPIHATSNFVPRLRTNDRPTPLFVNPCLSSLTVHCYRCASFSGHRPLQLILFAPRLTMTIKHRINLILRAYVSCRNIYMYKRVLMMKLMMLFSALLVQSIHPSIHPSIRVCVSKMST